MRSKFTSGILILTTSFMALLALLVSNLGPPSKKSQILCRNVKEVEELLIKQAGIVFSRYSVSIS